MTHELREKHHMVVTTLRYQCPCDNQEVITISVVFNEAMFANEIEFMEIMRSARRDMITEIRQHTGVKRG